MIGVGSRVITNGNSMLAGETGTVTGDHAGYYDWWVSIDLFAASGDYGFNTNELQELEV